MNKVYIAAPFFNPEQLAVVCYLELAMDRAGVHYYSPRSEGIIKDMTPTERIKRMRYLYNANVNNIDACEWIICVIDDFDTGTMFEMGYAAAKGKKIVTLSTFGHGLNLMLQQCAYAHVNDPHHAVACVNGQTYLGEIKKVIE